MQARLHFFIPCFVLILIVLASACSSSKSRDLLADSIKSTSEVHDRGTFPYLGEVLRFTARHVKMRAELADVEVRVSYPQKSAENKEIIRITAEGKSKPLISLVANIDDKAEVYIDPKTWESIYAYKYLNENGREREFFVWFWHDDLRASVERVYKGNTLKREQALPKTTMDSVAWIYWIRSSKLEVGKQYAWYTFDGWTINHIKLHVTGMEEVWTPLGFYSCFKIEIYRQREDALNPLGALSGVFVDPEITVDVPEYRLGTAWFANNEAKTPVRLSIQTALGDFDLLLKEIATLAK